MKTLPLLSCFCALVPFINAANATDDASEALQDTQNLLTNPTRRAQKIESDPNAKKVDQGLKSLLKDDKSVEDSYKLASDIFADIVKKTQGDPDKMRNLIEEAQKNPEAFGNQLSEEQKRKISELAKKIETQPNLPTARK